MVSMSDQSSVMMKVGGTQMDDLSSQGSYMVKIGKQHSEAEGGFSDMQSQGSYMVRGFNGQIGNRPIFDDDSDGSFIR